jgi:hypothetical protein
MSPGMEPHETGRRFGFPPFTPPCGFNSRRFHPKRFAGFESLSIPKTNYQPGKAGKTLRGFYEKDYKTGFGNNNNTGCSYSFNNFTG